MSEDNFAQLPGDEKPEAVEDWEILGYIQDASSAGYARETLLSCDIPAVVFSQSGYFGQIGLNLPAIWKDGQGWFQIRVKHDDIEEAREILDMILGQTWRREP